MNHLLYILLKEKENLLRYKSKSCWDVLFKSEKEIVDKKLKEIDEAIDLLNILVRGS